MSGSVAAAVEQIKQRIGQQMVSRAPRALNELRNKEIQTLTNPSPSAPGNPPGIRNGDLRKFWTGQVLGGAGGGGIANITVEIQSDVEYASYLEHGTFNEDGTRKMEARPFVDKIRQAALPGIVAIYSEPYS